jgi:hypothetical protein
MDQNFSQQDNAQLIEGDNDSPMDHSINLLEILDGASFPASKMELIAYAQDKGASEEALDQLQAIPDDIYNSLDDVNRHSNDIEVIEGAENLFSSEPSHDLPDEAEHFVSDMNGSGRV